MNRVSQETSAAQRARWLAELSEALEDARSLVKQLGAMDGRIEAVELYARIEAIRFEIHAMRLGGRTEPASRSDPEWSKNLPWQHRA